MELFNKFDKALITVIVILIVLVYIIAAKAMIYESENERLVANQSVLMDEVQYYMTEAGHSAASVEELTLTNSELKAGYADVCKVADELGVKVKRLEAAAKTATKTKVKVVTQIKDSIVYVAGVGLDSLKVFRWQDPWVEVQGAIRADSVALDVASSDTLTTIIHRVPHKFWFIKWGCKAIRQEVVSSNPHTKITYTEYINMCK